MADTIPADPGIVLGNVLPLKKKEYLLEIAEARNPQDIAQQKLHNLTLSYHKLSGVYQDMVNAGVDAADLKKLDDEKNLLKKAMVKAALDLGNACIAVEAKVRAIEAKYGQKKITFNFESPIDFSASEIKKMPVSYDSTNMDVNYFRNETEKDGSTAENLASKIYKHVSSTFAAWSTPEKAQNLSKSAHRVMEQQTQNHSIDGVIVITAHCTHKMASIYEPLVLNPAKTVRAWNGLYPKDKIKTTKEGVYKAAGKKLPKPAAPAKTGDAATEPAAAKAGDEEEDKPVTDSTNMMHLVTGATYGSSFVGFVHIKQESSSSNSQKGASLASSIQGIAQNAFGDTKSFGDNTKSLLSNSHVDTHCSLVTEGVIPQISSNTVTTSVMSLKPEPKEIMDQIQAISSASNETVNESLEAAASRSALTATFMKMNNSYLETAVSALAEENKKENQVFDLNSLMTAFTNYVDVAKSGESGFFENFFLRELTKKDVAETYMNAHFPEGA
eukprot:CAMPEP_0194212706 /NCGR_PEP_ID=MMETSP0156-20130528/12742_1 /TAXON_ID=33649 /ORGANISM="Thalassionema nitzschioides, Strain L26-B" /LENGTH=499 /DNA_ID=CAMNT_0038940579 /DNA_START=23 /DNA_END=1522 /DNA_ORIENTATION=+